MKSITLSLLLGFSCLVTTAQKEVFFCQHSTPDSMNAAFGSFVLNSFGANLYTQAKQGQIALYQDADLKIMFGPKEAGNIFFKFENQQIINPDNPDDPYDLIDTAIATWISPYDWINLKVTSDYLMLHSSQFGVKIAYVKIQDVKKLLYGDLILASLNLDNDPSIQGNTFGFAVQHFYDALQWRLFNSLHAKPNFMYDDLECSPHSISKMKMHDFCIFRESHQIINPQNPTDPYDLIDTVVTAPSSQESILGIDYYSKSDLNGNSTLQSLSLHCRNRYSVQWEWNQKIQNYIPINPNFYIKCSQLESLIGKEDTRYLMLNYVWALSLGN